MSKATFYIDCTRVAYVMAPRVMAPRVAYCPPPPGIEQCVYRQSVSLSSFQSLESLCCFGPLCSSSLVLVTSYYVRNGLYTSQ